MCIRDSSGSGRTETVVNLARKAKACGAQVLAITSSQATPLAEVADVTVITPAASVKTEIATPTRLPLANALEQAMAIYLDCICLLYTSIQTPPIQKSLI